MRKLLFTTMVVLFLCGVMAELPGSAQNRRRRSRVRAASAAPQVSSIQEMDFGTPEERAKILEECSQPGRAEPEAEFKRPGNALLCGKAISLPKPSYPAEAKAQNISGRVVVNVVVDEKGRIIWAEAVDGHPLLQAAAARAACGARFSPIKISGRPIKAAGIISYNFVTQ